MPSRLRAARTSFLALAATATVALLVFAAVDLLATSGEASHGYVAARSGDDYLVATVPQVPRDAIVQGQWTTSLGAKAPDRILLVPYEDLDGLLRGEAPAHAFRQINRSTWSEGVGGYFDVNQGDLVLEMVHVEPAPFGRYSFPYECAACKDDPRLAIVWTRGEAWQGAPLARGEWTVDGSGHVAGDAPVLWRGVYTEHNFYLWFALLMDGTLTLGGLAILAGLWWGAEAWRDRRSRPPPSAPQVGTDDLLRLVRLSERYLDTVWRYQAAGGAALAVAVVALSSFAVPALLAASRRHFLNPFDMDVVIVLTPLFLGGIAFVAWSVAVGRVRAERRRWRTIRQELDAASERILAP